MKPNKLSRELLRCPEMAAIHKKHDIWFVKVMYLTNSTPVGFRVLLTVIHLLYTGVCAQSFLLCKRFL